MPYLVSFWRPRQTWPDANHLVLFPVPDPKCKMMTARTQSHDINIWFLISYLTHPTPLTTNTISFLFRVCTRFEFYIFSRKKKERYKLSSGPQFPAHRMLPLPRTSPPLRQPDQAHLLMPDPQPRPPGPRRPAAPQPEKSRLARGFPGQWGRPIF